MAVNLRTIQKMITNVEDRIKRNHASMDIAVSRVVNKIAILENLLMARIDDVIAAVADETSVISSVGVLLDKLTADIADLKAHLADSGVDTAKVDELFNAVSANKDLLRAAVVKNTPEEGSVDEHGLTM